MRNKRIQFPLTLSIEAKEKFNEFIKDTKINKSKLIEWILINYISNSEQGGKI